MSKISCFHYILLLTVILLIGFSTTFAVEPSILDEMTSNRDVKVPEDAKLADNAKMEADHKDQQGATVPPAHPASVSAPIALSAIPPNAVLVATATVPAPTKKEKESLEEHVNLVSQFTNPNELINYFQEKVWTRDYKKAIACIDFTASSITEKTKKNIVGKLNIIFSRLEEKNVSDYPTDKKLFVQSFQSPRGTVNLEFILGDHNTWVLSYRNIQTLDHYFELLRNEPPIRSHWLMKSLPNWSSLTIGGIPIYCLYVLVGGLLLGILSKILIQGILYHITVRLLNPVLAKGNQEKLSTKFWSPIGMIILLTFLYEALVLIISSPDVQTRIWYTFAILCIVLVTRMLFRTVNVFSILLRHHMGNRNSHIDDIFIPLFSRTMKILAFCFGLIAIAHVFGWSMLGIISGMGIGGVAIAFAAKETIGNFFGSLTVLFDRPFVIGDWIIIDDVEGTVESVGMRSTRVRTHYNSVVTIPNNNLNTAVIDNMGARIYRRYKTTLYLEHGCEPARIEAFCEGIRELIRRHPKTRKDVFHVYLHEFKQTSLDILLVVFFNCPDTPTEYRERSCLMLDILRLAKVLDVRFAFPTQTLYTIPTEERPTVPMSSDPLTQGRSAAIEVYPIEE